MQDRREVKGNGAVGKGAHRERILLNRTARAVSSPVVPPFDVSALDIITTGGGQFEQRGSPK